MTDCVFCKIVKAEVPSSIVFQTEEIIAFKNIDPAADVHFLIIPTKHIPTFLDIGEKDGNLVTLMFEAARKLVKEYKIENAYKLVFNGGRFQAVQHLHWHLLGGKIHNIEKT